jgi:hypothetical protein
VNSARRASEGAVNYIEQLDLKCFNQRIMRAPYARTPKQKNMETAAASANPDASTASCKLQL